MAKRGYVKVPRALFQTAEWEEKRRFSRFEAEISLYEQAAYTDGRLVHVRGVDILLRRGQLVATVRTLAEKWGWSPSAVDRFLRKMRDSRRDDIRIDVETLKGTVASRITICNYDCCDDEVDESETTDGTQPETADGTADGTYNERKGSNTGNGEQKEIPTNQLVRDFKIACAQADTREAAFACFKELLDRGFFASEEIAVLPDEYRLLAWLWLYYPALQRKFDAPLIAWQARKIIEDYGGPDKDISRVIERMANTKGIETKYNSFYSTLRQWLKSDFVRKEREAQNKN